jgi:hypothetical protein
MLKLVFVEVLWERINEILQSGSRVVPGLGDAGFQRKS